jgi:DNA-binding NarL/FixJ family response regulator
MADETITLFLADDHTMVREGIAALASKEPGFKVIGQCGEGLAVIDEVLRLVPDVVVLDIMMPGLNGLDVCRELTRKVKDAAVLILSMYEDEQFIARALEYGASGYLLKDSAPNQLGDAIRAVSRGELFLGPGIPRTVLHHMSDHRDPYETLTTRERQVLQCVAEGMTNRQIAENLGLAVKTVDTHRMRLMRKLNIHDQTNLVKFAVRRGLVSLH